MCLSSNITLLKGAQLKVLLYYLSTKASKRTNIGYKSRQQPSHRFKWIKVEISADDFNKCEELGQIWCCCIHEVLYVNLSIWPFALGSLHSIFSYSGHPGQYDLNYQVSRSATNMMILTTSQELLLINNSLSVPKNQCKRQIGIRSQASKTNLSQQVNLKQN